MIIFEIFIFGFTLWLGVYLINRNPSEMRLLLAGIGLMAYGAALALGILATYGGSQALTTLLLSWQRPLLLIPAICWLLILFRLMHGDVSWYSRLQSHPRPLVVTITATVFFGLGLALLIVPFDWIPRKLLLLGIGVDLLLLGAAVAFLDAFDEGETLLPHMSRSFTYAFIVTIIFGGQIGLVMILSTGLTSAMLMLLIGAITTAIILQTFSSSIQIILDTIILYRSPRLVKTQATLREAANSASRQNENSDLSQIDAQGFVRLTRRALSHMGNIPRLSTSPLTHLPIIDERLSNQNNPLDTLQRATELRVVLTESIDRLKPEKDGQLGMTDQ